MIERPRGAGAPRPAVQRVARHLRYVDALCCRH
jgi:hypothetical protein